jgi:AcrR family transcriptional regulator
MAHAQRLIDAVLQPQRMGAREAQRRQIVLSTRLAALQLFRQDGYANVTIEQIAARARIAPRTFFNHFTSKEECVVFPHREFSEPLRDLVVDRPATEHPLIAVGAAFIELFGALDTHSGIRNNMRLGARLQAEEPALRSADGSYRRIWEDVVTEALQQRGCSKLEARIFAVASVGTLKAAMLEWGQLEEESPMATAARNGFAILISGVATSLDPIDVAVQRASQEPALVIDSTDVDFSDLNDDGDDGDESNAEIKVSADA